MKIGGGAGILEPVSAGKGGTVMPDDATVDFGDCHPEITARQQRVIEWLPDTIFQVSRSGIILMFKPSKQYSKLMASTAVQGQHLSAVLPAHSLLAALDAINAALDTGRLQIFEYSITQEHDTTYLEARVTKAGEEEVLVIVRDVSEWRRSEAYDLLLLDMSIKIREERSLEEILSLVCERIVAIFDLRLVWVGRHGSDHVVKFCAAEAEITRFLQEKTMEVSAGSGPTGTALRTGKFQLMDIEDPRLLPWRAWLDEYAVATGAAFPLKLGGRILGTLTVFTGNRDFWTKKTIIQLTNLAEQVALAIDMLTNRQRLRLLTTGLESAANAVVIASRNGSIQWVNSAFLKLHGYSAAEVMSGNIRMLESGRHPRSFYKVIWQYVSAGRMWHGEMINRRKDGTRYTAETTITPVRDEAGKVANYISIINDVTQRKQAEIGLLEAREAMARAERLSALGIMAAGIAHEINQPLNSLKVLADGMLYWYGKGKVPDISSAMENIREISKDAERIDAIIKHMRSFIFHNESAGPQLCDINLAVEESLSLLGAQLHAHSIEVKTDLANRLPPVWGTCIQCEQIIINLLVNAMHALDTIDRPDKQITVATSARRGHVLLAVGDNGPGISGKLKNKVFDPFFTTKSTGRGMGLGLSVVHSIVTSYGGKIRVQDNKPAGGAILRVEFPVATDKQKGAEST